MNFSHLYLINTHNGYVDSQGKRVDPIDIENYPTVKTHLDKFLEKLEKRKDYGNTIYNLRSLSYMEDFYRPKIMYPEIVQHPRFYLDDKGKYFAEASAFIITGENIKILTEILNDDVFGWIFKTFYAGGGLGKGYRYKKSYLLNLPLPQVSKALEYPEVDFNFLKNSYNLTDKEVEYLFKKIY